MLSTGNMGFYGIQSHNISRANMTHITGLINSQAYMSYESFGTFLVLFRKQKCIFEKLEFGH